MYPRVSTCTDKITLALSCRRSRTTVIHSQMKHLEQIVLPIHHESAAYIVFFLNMLLIL
jgi:hypothetical protein